MPVSADFRLFLLDQLGQVTQVQDRKMFGGLGVYSGDLFFAVVDDDVVYLKADDRTAPRFEAEGMKPFAPMGPGTKPMAYWELPGRALEDVDELKEWVTLALEAARRAKGAKTSRTSRKPAAAGKAPKKARSATSRSPRGAARKA
jgi:DNA transformation protein and related proteins